MKKYKKIYEKLILVHKHAIISGKIIFLCLCQKRLINIVYSDEMENMDKIK